MSKLLQSIRQKLLPPYSSLWKQRLELAAWALLLSFAYYDGPFGFVVWFSLARPLMIIGNLKGKRAFTASYWYGFCFNLFTIYWISLVTPPGTLAAIAIVAIYYAIALTIFNRLFRYRKLFGILSAPFLWVGIEYFRTLTQFAFPWSDLGYTQAGYLYILQIVSLISVHGLSFLIVTVNVLVWQMLRSSISYERRLTSLFVSVGLIVVLAASGWVVIPKYPVEGNYPVAILQGSVPLKMKWERSNEQYSLRLYDSLTQSVADSTINLYVWPETAAPSYLSHTRSDRLVIGDIARRSNGYHLVGALGANTDSGRQDAYNSCYQVSPEGNFERRYDKVKLVPFSEHVPYQDQLPFLRKEFLTRFLTFIETYDIQWWSDFRPGDSLILFDLPNATYGVLICFESAFPEYAAKAVRDGAHFLVGITNDTWFEGSVGPYMHSRIFMTRAVENRIWVVRAANSGISYIMDGYGRIRTELPVRKAVAMKGSVRLLDSYTLFTKEGDIIGRLSFLISASLLSIFVLIWVLKRFRSKPQY